jgi:hypothetical protein
MSACTDPANQAFPMIIKPKCGLCHTPAAAVIPGNLDLDSPGAKQRLLNVPARTCNGKVLVTDRGPGMVGGHFFDKIAGMVMGCGDRMPPIGTALTPAEVKCLKDWIDPGN